MFRRGRKHIPPKVPMHNAQRKTPFPTTSDIQVSQSCSDWEPPTVIANRVPRIRITRDKYTVTQREFRGRAVPLASVFRLRAYLNASPTSNYASNARRAIVINSDIARAHCAPKAARCVDHRSLDHLRNKRSPPRNTRLRRVKSTTLRDRSRNFRSTLNLIPSNTLMLRQLWLPKILCNLKTISGDDTTNVH